jgi:ring-1,2-phenylacetyl-CoA epoxidase subunit PaaD
VVISVADTPTARASAAAGSVLDPEVPVVTIADLGVLRDVTVDPAGRVIVTVTPTYSGCPAMDVIRRDVEDAVHAAGFSDVEVRTVLSPPWTTDALTDRGRRALLDYGIAPPQRRTSTSGPILVSLSVRCPQCDSPDTRELSHFGSTACKSMWACNSCLEPFDHFKVF